MQTLMPFLVLLNCIEELVTKGYESEVAIVGGRFNRGIEADEKIILEFRQIISQFKAEGVVIVSDGEDDETVIPNNTNHRARYFYSTNYN